MPAIRRFWQEVRRARFVRAQSTDSCSGCCLTPSTPTIRSDLGQGEYIVLYTDGIPETQNPGGDFLDLDRVRTWLTSGGGQTAARFADTTLENLRSWRGGNAFDDDVTLVVARFA